MSKIKMVMFDLSGTTVHDDTGVRDCLHQAAVEFGLPATPDEILLHMGTNKIHLYQFLIARSQGKAVDFRDFAKGQDPATLEFATKVFPPVRGDHDPPLPDPGSERCRGHRTRSVGVMTHGIKVATDTGFHKAVTLAIMDGSGVASRRVWWTSRWTCRTSPVSGGVRRRS
jgi:beta-phosphoglucomutase-like phosphatase (HAD superfamily)